MVGDFLRAEACDQRQPARFVVRVENVNERQKLIGLERRSTFHPSDSLCRGRIQCGRDRLTRAVADP